MYSLIRIGGQSGRNSNSKMAYLAENDHLWNLIHKVKFNSLPNGVIYSDNLGQSFFTIINLWHT